MCASQEEGDLDATGGTVAQFLIGGILIAFFAGILWLY